jgi:hypothetical protein
MPNWCSNSLKLVATTAESEKKLTEIVSAIARAIVLKENPPIFEMIRPVPEDLKITAGFLGRGTPEQAELETLEADNLKHYGYKNWHGFCMAEWGTKWDMSIADSPEVYKIEGNAVTIYFDTAWSPPEGIYHALEAMGFKVEATYIEQGVGFIGHYKNGIDICEDMNQFYPVTDNEEDEDEFFYLCKSVDKFFKDAGFDHSPPNLGG